MYKFLALVVISATLTGCISAKKGPDEMAVIDSVPLTLPPSFELRPPRQGQSAEVAAANRKVEKLVLGKQNAKSAQSRSRDSWLIQKAGGETRNESIREIMAKEARQSSKEEDGKGWFDKVFDDETNVDPSLEELAKIQRQQDTQQQ